MKPEHSHDLNRRIPLKDEDRRERRVLTDSESIGCAPLLFCCIGYAVFAKVSWHLVCLLPF